MGLIGDVYYAFRGDGARLTKDAQVEGAKAGKGLAQSTAASFKKSWSGANIGKGFVQGLGLAGGLGAISAISGALNGLTDALADSVKGAIADQESQNRLRASLLANVPAWKINTAEIERNIKAKQRLAFDDETLRDSLTVLAGATHDVTKAQEIQNTAMDLARFKGIDLKTASEALIKVEAGQYRMLKQLGINLRTNATSEEALAAVQAVAFGQAEAYANTTAGKMEAAQIAINEQMEELGYKLLPVVSSGLDTLNVLLGGTADSYDELVKRSEKTGFLDIFGGSEAQFRLERLDKVAKELGVDVKTLYRIVQDQGINIGAASVDDYRMAIGEMADEVTTSAEKMRTHAFDVVDKEAIEMGVSVEQGARNSIQWMQKFTDNAISDAKRLRGEAFDETEIRATLHDTRMEIKALAQQRRDAKTAEERRQASDDIVQAIDDEGQALEDLAATGDLTQKDVDRFTKDAKLSYDSLSKEGRADVDALIKKYTELVKQPDIQKSFEIIASIVERDKGSKRDTHGKGRGKLEYADGGYRPPGVASWVGEHGRELSVPTQGSIIIPHEQSERIAAAAMKSDGGVTMNIGVLDRRTMADVRRELMIISDRKQKGW